MFLLCPYYNAISFVKQRFSKIVCIWLFEQFFGNIIIMLGVTMEDTIDFTCKTKEFLQEQNLKSLEFVKAAVRYETGTMEKIEGGLCPLIFFNAEDVMKELYFILSLERQNSYSEIGPYPYSEAGLAMDMETHDFLTYAQILPNQVLNFATTFLDFSIPCSITKEELMSLENIGSENIKLTKYKDHDAAYIFPLAIYKNIKDYCLFTATELSSNARDYYTVVDFTEHKILLASEKYKDIIKRIIY